MLPFRREVTGSMISGWGAAATIGSSATGLGRVELSSANLPRQLSKVGVVVGADGLEVTEMRKTGSFDMRVAQETVEGGGLYYNHPYFVVLMLADTKWTRRRRCPASEIGVLEVSNTTLYC